MSEEKLARADLDLIRQWFDSLQDVNPKYLQRQDYALAFRVYESLGMVVPISIVRGIANDR